MLQARGLVFLHKERYSEAIIDFTKAIEIDPENPELFWHRGGAYFSLEDFSNAEKDLRKAIELGVEEGFAYQELAMSQIILGKFDEAKLTINSYLSLHPNSEIKSEFEELLTLQRRFILLRHVEYYYDVSESKNRGKTGLFRRFKTS